MGVFGVGLALFESLGNKCAACLAGRNGRGGGTKQPHPLSGQEGPTAGGGGGERVQLVHNPLHTPVHTPVAGAETAAAVEPAAPPSEELWTRHEDGPEVWFTSTRGGCEWRLPEGAKLA
jgi:hypothetical protein